MEAVEPESAAEPAENHEFLFKLLEIEEYNELNVNVKEKIETAVQERNNAFLVQEALHQSVKSAHDEVVQQLRTDLDQRSAEIEVLRNKWQAAAAQVASLQILLATATGEAETAEESCKQMRYEWQDYKTQRDLACDEKESLQSMIDRRNNELALLREEKANLTDQIKAAKEARSAAVESAEEVESLRISLEYKQRRFEQEASLLQSHVESLSEQLEVKSSELLDLRRSMSAQAVSAESEVAAKTEELRIAVETIADLRDSNDKLTAKAEELSDKVSAQRESYDVMMDNFHQELSAQTKLAQLYKDMCSENESKTQQLTNAIQELRKLLAEATTRYGDLETSKRERVLRLEEEIAKRDECIQHLKQELLDANDLLQAAKQESMDAAIGSLSPCAAAASRLIKSGMTLTQIYSQYARVSEELLLEKEESRRLNLYVTTIVREIEEKAPLLQQQRADYEKAVAAAESLTQQMDLMVSESQLLAAECADAKKTSTHLTRENQRLQKELADLARQVCYLVKAVEEARGGAVAHDTAYDALSLSGSAQHVISKHLVTFATIEDLQENNQKLLALVRQLSEKHEAVETVSSSQFHELKAKKDTLEQRVAELIDEMARQSKMLDLIRTQSATYKKLYHQAMGSSQDTPQSPSLGSPATPTRASPGPVTSTPLPGGPTHGLAHAEELQKKLTEAKEKVKKLEEEIDKLRKEGREKEQALVQRADKLMAEARELTYANSKLVAQAEYNQEKSKVLETNLKSSKQQVTALEDRNRALSEICAKHEQSLIILKDQAMDAQAQLARAEARRDSLNQDVLHLKTQEARLTKEREAMNRERINNSQLMSNLDGLKAALDRSEAEGKLRLEVQLGEALRECSALRSVLRDEKERFAELGASMERQTALAKQRAQEEKELANRARDELDTVSAELQKKTRAVAELTEKLRELANQPTRSIIQSASSTLDVSGNRVKALMKQVGDMEEEVTRLQIQLTAARSGSQQYQEIAEAAEKQLQSLVQEHHCCPQVLSDKEKEWTMRVQEVEARLEEAVRENERLNKEEAARDRTNGEQVELVTAQLRTMQVELDAKKAELTSAQAELQTLSRELKASQDQITQAQQEAAAAEARYSQELVQHSHAIQALAEAKQRAQTIADAEGALRAERDDALAQLASRAVTWDEQKARAEAEVESLNTALRDVEAHNTALHDALHILSDRMEILEAKLSSSASRGDGGDLDSSLNASASGELGEKAREELVKVVRFLRHEKDVATTRSEVLTAESGRLRVQVALLQRQLDEATQNLKALKETSVVEEKISAKHAQLLRKVESLNAVTDSNRLLREERDRFKAQSAELAEQLAAAQVGVAPLRTELTALTARVDTLTTENEALAADVTRWKARAVQLSERTKASPEDVRRLTAERDSLAKQCAAEKASGEKLEEAMKKLRAENAALTGQVQELRKQLQAESTEVRRLTEESKALKAKQVAAEQDLATLRAQVTQLTLDQTKAAEDRTAKENTITALRAKEVQLTLDLTKIRTIAKKYKTQCEQLIKTADEEKTKRAAEDALKLEEEQKPVPVPEAEAERLRAEGRAQALAQQAENEARVRNEARTEGRAQALAQLTEVEARLGGQAAAAAAEAEALRTDNETLKTSIAEKEDRAKQVIKTARARIVQLVAEKAALEQQLAQAQGHDRDESDSKLSALRANYDARIARMESERAEQAEQTNQERERTASQIKALNQRVLQLQRSLDKPKASTSSQPATKSTMEPPTANIKPMAGSSTARKQKQTPAQQLVGPYWSGGNETPFASIRPVQTRTLAVPPTSLGGAAASGPVPHTTGPSTSAEALSSSPTSSHTDYMPATSSATPVRVVAPVPLNAQSTQEVECIVEEVPVAQAVAMVVPRVEAAASSPALGPSTSGQASSSNTVTTTQAGLKRVRDADGAEGADIEHKPPQGKRSRPGLAEYACSQGGEVEYQVPTSSQRDQEDDMVIMLVDSEDEANADEDVEEPDDGFEEEDNGESYEVESYSRDGQDMGQFEEGPDIDEENVADGSNEVEIIEDSNEVPSAPAGQQSSEATSSHSADHVVVSQSFRTRSVPPLNRAQPSLLAYEEGGDDSIVPSTPTLFLPRREAVSSPQVPHQRFTFSDPGGAGRNEAAPGEDGTGRSVPTTPLVASPQEQDLPEPAPHPTVPHVPEEQMPPPDPTGAVIDDELRAQDDDADDAVAGLAEEDNDGVTSEGEKPAAGGSGDPLEEGREAEASEPIARVGGTARRSGRPAYPRRGVSRRPTPIVWNEPGSSGLPTNVRPTGRGQTRGRPTRRNWP